MLGKLPAPCCQFLHLHLTTMRTAFALALALIVAPELCSATTEEGKAWLAANAEKDGVVELPCAACAACLRSVPAAGR